MLTRQGIMPVESARACLHALDALDRDRIRAARYDGQFEDLFFYVESELDSLAGADHAGRMHTARSRNDICIALYRMRLRREALSVVEAVHGLRATLLALAREHATALMPAYTHTQPAQPTTLGHYLMAFVEVLGRDETRLRLPSLRSIARPWGHARSRPRDSRLTEITLRGMLGFEGLQLNSYGAIGATDYVTELAGAVATAMANLGKFVQDLLLWCNPTLGFLRLSDAWVQISSIMPQKRNPVPLEHTRILASRALAEAQGVFTCVHNTPFGDINDSEDDIQPIVFTMTSNSQRALRLITGLLGDCEFRVERMAQQADADFLTVTELADTLVRNDSFSFREAHHLVSRAVKSLAGTYSPDAMAQATLDLAVDTIGRTVRLTKAQLQAALSPRTFIEIRTIAGGPGALGQAFHQAEAEAANVDSWINVKRSLMASYVSGLRAASKEMAGPSLNPPLRTK